MPKRNSGYFIANLARFDTRLQNEVLCSQVASRPPMGIKKQKARMQKGPAIYLPGLFSKHVRLDGFCHHNAEPLLRIRPALLHTEASAGQHLVHAFRCEFVTVLGVDRLATSHRNLDA